MSHKKKPKIKINTLAGISVRGKKKTKSRDSISQTFKKVPVFFAGADEAFKQKLRGILDIPEAKLPVKYLGVPLISSKLRHSDCVVLKDRMLTRIQSGSNKQLSFGGRAQLISSVLFSIQTGLLSSFCLKRLLRRLSFSVERAGVEIYRCQSCVGCSS